MIFDQNRLKGVLKSLFWVVSPLRKAKKSQSQRQSKRVCRDLNTNLGVKRVPETPPKEGGYPPPSGGGSKTPFLGSKRGSNETFLDDIAKVTF